MSDITLRPLVPEDAPALVDFHNRCSEQTHYYRFFTPRPTLKMSTAQTLCTVDGVRDGALAAVHPDEPETILGVGRWYELDPDRCEVAFTVEDAHHHRGIGRRLFDAVASHARAAGYRKLTGDVLAQNRPMRGLLASSGLPLREGRPECGAVPFVLDLPTGA